MTGTLNLPEIGSKNTVADERVLKLLEQYRALLNASNKIEAASLENGITNTQLSGAAAITDANLASPNNSAYKFLMQTTNFLLSETGAGTYILGSSGSNKNPAASGINLIAPTTPPAPSLIGFAKADYEVGSRTQKLRLRAQVAVNATKPTIKFTVGLYPVTVAGGAAEVKITLGTVVSGSTLEINEPAASTVASSVGSDFTIPSDGTYALGVVTSGTLTASSALLLSTELQTRNV